MDNASDTGVLRLGCSEYGGSGDSEGCVVMKMLTFYHS